MKKYPFIGPLTAMILPLALFYCMKYGLIMDPYSMHPEGHFYIVSVVAFLSSIIAIAVGVAGKRLRNIKVSFLALSFISLALILMLHGLSTPSLILHMTNLPGAAAQLSILSASVWLWLSSLPSDYKVIECLAKKQKLLLPIWCSVLSLFVVISMLNPKIVDAFLLQIMPIKYIVIVITLLLNLHTIYRYYQTYRFSRFPLQLAIVYSAGWFICSQIIMATGTIWHYSWWLYHYLLLASMLIMLFGLLKQYASNGTFYSALRGLFTNDPFERITSSVSPSVRKLIQETEKKDAYTAGHTFRVTMYALQLAEEMKLKPELLRAIAQGALVHDVGKIQIPDDILNKSEKLSDQERKIIEQHPVMGYEMCKNLGFMKEELQIIRSHHEKWDGSGYPDQLKGEKIHLLARVVAVADVYDALTSERSYRKAWSHNQAMDFLIKEKGSHFDPYCVEAWKTFSERNPPDSHNPLDLTSKLSIQKPIAT